MHLDEPYDVTVSDQVAIPSSHTDSQVFIQVLAAGLNPVNYKVIPAKMPFIRHLKVCIPTCLYLYP